MRKPLIVLPDAEDEAAEAREWYDVHAERVAPRFVSELSEVLDEVRARPRSFAPHDLSCRVAFLKTFPYYIVFRERESDILVVAISHASRRPRYWRSRLKD